MFLEPFLWIYKTRSTPTVIFVCLIPLVNDNWDFSIDCKGNFFIYLFSCIYSLSFHKVHCTVWFNTPCITLSLLSALAFSQESPKCIKCRHHSKMCFFFQVCDQQQLWDMTDKHLLYLIIAIALILGVWIVKSIIYTFNLNVDCLWFPVSEQ